MHHLAQHRSDRVGECAAFGALSRRLRAARVDALVAVAHRIKLPLLAGVAAVVALGFEHQETVSKRSAVSASNEVP